MTLSLTSTSVTTPSSYAELIKSGRGLSARRRSVSTGKRNSARRARDRLVLALLGIVALISFPRACSSTLVKPIHIRDCVRLAGLAFAGTVSKITYEDLSTTIVTHVEFKNLKIVKGVNKSGSLTLNLEGGTNGKLRVVVDGQPEFEIGNRYVLLTKSDLGSPRNTYAPIVGLFQGFFPVRPDTKSGLPVVTDWVNRPVVRIESAGLVVVDPRWDGKDQAGAGSPQDQGIPIEVIGRMTDPGTRMSENQFLGAIRRLAAEK